MCVQSAQVELTHSSISNLVMDSLRDVLSLDDGAGVPLSGIRVSTSLIGQHGVLDSMGLVTLIVDVEQRLEEEHGIVLILADDRAMSQSKSPFRSVGSLVDHICALMSEHS